MCRIIIELSSPIDFNEDVKRALTIAIEEVASDYLYGDELFTEDQYLIVKRIVATEDDTYILRQRG